MTKYELRINHRWVSSINPHFTFNYVQPDEYRFSHDSVFLARKVFEIILDKKLKHEHILDLCSGCGIVGLDLLFHLNAAGLVLPKEIDFLEVQAIYNDFFETNAETIRKLSNKNVDLNFLNINYQTLVDSDKFVQQSNSFSKKYDLIISNPPYFRKDQGVLSKSEFKNRCRFFIDSDFKNLIQAIDKSLKSDGHAFILLKSLTEHGINVEKEFENLRTGLVLKSLGLIRDTGFYEITKSV